MVLSLEMVRGHRRTRHLRRHAVGRSKRGTAGRVLGDSDSRDPHPPGPASLRRHRRRAVPIQQVQGGGERPQGAIQEIREMGVA